MTYTFPALTLTVALTLLASPALAQTSPAADHAHHGTAAGTTAAATTAAPASAALTDGEITRVDARTGKLTIRHGEITHLGMPPMTMVFALQDAAQAAQFQPGAKVRFQVVDDSGTLRITHIERAQ